MEYTCGVLIYTSAVKNPLIFGKKIIEVIHFTHTWQYTRVSFQLTVFAFQSFNTLLLYKRHGLFWTVYVQKYRVFFRGVFVTDHLTVSATYKLVYKHNGVLYVIARTFARVSFVLILRYHVYRNTKTRYLSWTMIKPRKINWALQQCDHFAGQIGVSHLVLRKLCSIGQAWLAQLLISVC